MGSTGATDEVDEMALTEEAIAEADGGIAEGTDLLAGAETKTEDTRDEYVIHPYFQVPTVEHTYNLQQGMNQRTDYTNIYEFQSTIIHCAQTQLSMKRGLNKFKFSGGKSVTAELEQLHRRDSFQTVRTENLSEKQKHESLVLIMFLKEKQD